MSDAELQAAYVIGPRMGTIAVVATSTGVVGMDLATLFPKAIQEGRMIRLEADGASVYWFLNTSAAGTPGPTDTSTTGQCSVIEDGDHTEFFPEGGYHFVRAILASGSGYLRAYPSSKPPHIKDP